MRHPGSPQTCPPCWTRLRGEGQGSRAAPVGGCTPHAPPARAAATPMLWLTLQAKHLPQALGAQRRHVLLQIVLDAHDAFRQACTGAEAGVGAGQAARRGGRQAHAASPCARAPMAAVAAQNIGALPVERPCSRYPARPAAVPAAWPTTWCPSRGMAAFAAARASWYVAISSPTCHQGMPYVE